jgi:chaperonin GroES
LTVPNPCIYTSDFRSNNPLPTGSAVIQKEKISTIKGGLRMKIRPLYDRIIVRRVAEEEKTKGESSSPTPQRTSPPKAKSWQQGQTDRGRKVIPMDVRRATDPFQQVRGNEVKIDGVSTSS